MLQRKKDLEYRLDKINGGHAVQFESLTEDIKIVKIKDSNEILVQGNEVLQGMKTAVVMAHIIQ